MPEIQCPSCGERLDVPVELLGQTIRCGACQSVIEAGMVAPPQARMASQRPREEYRDESRFSDEPPRKKSGLTWLWLLFGCGGLSCAGCCGGVVLLFYNAENPTWAKFTAPDGRFTVDFPGEKPQTRLLPLPIPNEKPLSITLYISERKLAKERYVVGVCDLPKSDEPLTKAEAEAYIDAALDALKNQQPGATVTDISKTKMTLFGQPGKEYSGTFSDPGIQNGRVTRRLFILNNRLYVLSVLGKDNGPSPAKLERFFSSFMPSDAAKKP
jgi:hypothetical protein